MRVRECVSECVRACPIFIGVSMYLRVQCGELILRIGVWPRMEVAAMVGNDDLRRCVGGGGVAKQCTGKVVVGFTSASRQWSVGSGWVGFGSVSTAQLLAHSAVCCYLHGQTGLSPHLGPHHGEVLFARRSMTCTAFTVVFVHMLECPILFLTPRPHLCVPVFVYSKCSDFQCLQQAHLAEHGS